jgi:hypothetical protein
LRRFAGAEGLSDNVIGELRFFGRLIGILRGFRVRPSSPSIYHTGRPAAAHRLPGSRDSPLRGTDEAHPANNVRPFHRRRGTYRGERKVVPLSTARTPA